MRLLHRPRPDLSIVVVGYDMAREIPRTLASLSRSYQTGLDGLVTEVVVVDNGSPEPLSAAMVRSFGDEFRLHRIDDAPASPAHAANLGVSLTRGSHVAVILDGARMVTPGVAALTVQAHRLAPRALVTPMAWHLGPRHQSLSIADGYGAAAEDALLDSVDWPSDGYRLFDVAALAGANPDGMLGTTNESCFLSVSRGLWEEVGGCDERFDLPGGGLVSLDLFTRLVTGAGAQLVVLLGEGSFHQVHGGASTSPGAKHALWAEQYAVLRGGAYQRPSVDPLYVGRLRDPARRWLTSPAP